MGKKILYVANLRLPTEKAYGIQIAKMCEAFAIAGNEVELICPKRKNPFRKDFFDFYSVERNFKIREIKSPDFYFPGKLDKAAVLIKNSISSFLMAVYALKGDWDVIYSRDELFVFLLGLFKSNVCLEAHKFYPSRSFLYFPIKVKGLKIFTISNGLKNEFVVHGFNPNNIFVAPDGVDLNRFDIDISKEDARKKAALPNNKPIVMYTGHLFDWKGADVLAQAASMVKNADFVFVGGTDSDILKFKKDFGNAENIKILGRKSYSEVPTYLKAADFLVIPNRSGKKISDVYTSPLKLFEYMASGRPIVASDLPSIGEILNSDNAVLVKANDPAILADGIKSILYNKELGERISKKANEDVKRYNWQDRAKSIIKFIG